MSMIPFYVAVEKESKETNRIIENVFRFFEEKGNVEIPRNYVGSGPWEEGEYGSVKWYVEEAYEPSREQVLTTKLWELFEKEPRQKNPHYELFILETDLYAPNTNFVFGNTRVKILPDGYIFPEDSLAGVVVSLNRLKRFYREGWKLSFFGILLHELGHFYGLPASSNPNFIKIGDKRAKSYLDYCHCDDRKCIMEQVNVPGRLDNLEKISLLLKENPQFFCEYDLKVLEKNLKRLYTKK